MENIKEIIKKKENKKELTYSEIEFVIKNFLNKKIGKSEMIQFLKTVYSCGMSEEETFFLTNIMASSGKILNLSKNDIFADKHSTGGISDSTTIIIAPIIACTGVKFLKMSGGRLGFTGGTVDKLECFKGYKTNISIEKAKELVNKNGAVLISQTEDLVPADKYIYKLRDETNTIMSIPLIASSIMSKKLATGNDIIVLDVKCGTGAFIKTFRKAKVLAELMVKIGKKADKKISAIISDMNQPLGQWIGDLLETIEAIDVLKGKNNRLSELSIFLASKIIQLSKNISFEKAKKLVLEILNSGKALNKLKTMVQDQGGSLDLFEKNYTNEILRNPIVIKSKKEGYISAFNLEKLGILVRDYCSAGNHGLKVLIKLGDYVKKEEPIFEVYGENTNIDFSSCIRYSKNKKITNKLIIDMI